MTNKNSQPFIIENEAEQVIERILGAAPTSKSSRICEDGYPLEQIAQHLVNGSITACEGTGIAPMTYAQAKDYVVSGDGFFFKLAYGCPDTSYPVRVKIMPPKYLEDRRIAYGAETIGEAYRMHVEGQGGVISIAIPDDFELTKGHN